MAEEQDAGQKIPVTEEVLVVGRQTVETGTVEISKTIETMQALVEEPVFTEEIKIERCRVDEPVSPAHPAEVRTEGLTTIIPILEEVVVVEKRLVVREEVRITRVRTARTVRQEIPLRREEVNVERSSVLQGTSHALPDESDQQEQR